MLITDDPNSYNSDPLILFCLGKESRLKRKRTDWSCNTVNCGYILTFQSVDTDGTVN